ncbi:MAG: Na+/H+ antiporter NhaA [Pseudomonadota bacterium]
MYRVSAFLHRFALALLAGVALATLWVNLSPASYYDLVELRLADLPLPLWLAPQPVSLTPLLVVSDGLMALFFFFVGKELWEALILDRGALTGNRAYLPLGLTVGGMAGAAGAWLLLSWGLQTAEEASFGTGWPVPLGTDVVLAYLVGRWVFGPGHPALHLLLLLCIGTDILALLVFGLAYPALSGRLVWLALPLLASAGVWAAWGRRPPDAASERRKRATLALWPYVLAGGLSWVGIVASGLPGALGLLPVIPAIAHADRAFGLFAEAEEYLHDPLNRLAHLLITPLAVVLFAFGLLRGGIDFAAFAPTTTILLGSLWLGRPLGMMLGGLAVALTAGLRLPPGVSLRDSLMVAVIMGLGFTVPLLAIDGALPGGAMQEAARLGAALSLGAAGLAGGLARLVRR